MPILADLVGKREFYNLGTGAHPLHPVTAEGTPAAHIGSGAYALDLLCTSGVRVKACASGPIGFEVDHDHLLQLVSVELGVVPELARPDLVEPERRIGLIRSDDAAHWGGLLKPVDELAELQGECDAMEEQDSLIVLRDLRTAIDESYMNGDEILQVEGTVVALPAGEILQERGSVIGVPNRAGPGEHLSTAADPGGKLIPQTRCKSSGRYDVGEPGKHSQQSNRGVVHFQRQHACMLAATA
ncbi:hypothetical protein [Streptomyces sp. NPDC002602]|uniref:hypothetical protein n=1 Tax=Streptomyces sp. NPDC002602 TaxID=3364654 RepID=UPI0036BA0099